MLGSHPTKSLPPLRSYLVTGAAEGVAQLRRQPRGGAARSTKSEPDENLQSNLAAQHAGKTHQTAAEQYQAAGFRYSSPAARQSGHSAVDKRD